MDCQSTDENAATSYKPQRKKKPFSLKSQLSVVESQVSQTDEVSRYKSTELMQFGLNLL